MADTDDIYEVFAIKYATHERDADLNFIDPPDIHDGPMPIDYFVWLARSQTRTVVIDTGFNKETAEARGREFLNCPTEGLKALGVAVMEQHAAAIELAHYAGDVLDIHGRPERFHAHVPPGGEGHFPVLQVEGGGREQVEVADVIVMEVRDDDVRDRIDVDAELFPGLSVHRIGGHTDGLQCVRVKTARGQVVLASDASHLYANRDRVNPYPIVFRVDEMLAGFERLGDLADSDGHIVPGHDPLVMAYYPAPEPELDGWIVRLDVAPQA